MKLSAQDKETFAKRGVLHLRGVISNSKVASAREALLKELARLHLRENGKWQIKQLGDIPPFKITGSISQKVKHQPAFNEVFPAELQSFIEALADLRLVPSQPNPQVLVTPPQRLVWSVPHLGWHLDIASPSRDEIPGVQAFVLLDEIQPQGGGTVAIAGSHRLHGAKDDKSRGVHQTLQNDPFYSKLFSADDSDRSRFLKSNPVAGVDLQVIEMCGKAGDVYLMDMRVLHAPAINASKKGRMMLTSRYLSSVQP